MKTIHIPWSRHRNAHDVEVPETYDEGYDLLIGAKNSYYGYNRRMAACCRVAFGLFRPDAHGPQEALCLLLQDLCKQEGVYFGNLAEKFRDTRSDQKD